MEIECELEMVKIKELLAEREVRSMTCRLDGLRMLRARYELQLESRTNASGHGRGLPRTVDPVVGNLDSEVTHD